MFRVKPNRLWTSSKGGRDLRRQHAPQQMDRAFVEALAHDDVHVARMARAPLDEHDRAALLAALDAALSSHRRAKSMLRRDQFIRTIAASHYTGSTRAKADRLGRDLKNYAASSWRRDKRTPVCRRDCRERHRAVSGSC